MKKTALRILVAVGISVFTSQLHLAIAASAPVEWTKKIISVPKKVQSKEVFSLQTYESNDREPVTQALSRELEIIRSEFHQDIKDHLGNPHAYHQVTVEIERMSSTFYVLTRRVSSWLGSAYPSDYSSRRYFHSTLLGPLKFGDIFSGDGWIEKICNLSESYIKEQAKGEAISFQCPSFAGDDEFDWEITRNPSGQVIFSLDQMFLTRADRAIDFAEVPLSNIKNHLTNLGLEIISAR